MFRNPPLPAFLSEVHDFCTFTFLTSRKYFVLYFSRRPVVVCLGSWRSSPLHLAMGRLGEWTILLCLLQPRVVLAAAPKPFCRRRAYLGRWSVVGRSYRGQHHAAHRFFCVLGVPHAVEALRNVRVMYDHMFYVDVSRRRCFPGMDAQLHVI